MSEEFYLERVIGSLFILIYCIRFLPKTEIRKHATNLPLVAVVVSMLAIVLVSAPIPKADALSAYLFFLMYALNIYKEYAKTGDVWQVKYVFAVLLAIATSLYHLTTAVATDHTTSSSKQPKKYDLHEDNDD